MRNKNLINPIQLGNLSPLKLQLCSLRTIYHCLLPNQKHQMLLGEIKIGGETHGHQLWVGRLSAVAVQDLHGIGPPPEHVPKKVTDIRLCIFSPISKVEVCSMLLAVDVRLLSFVNNL